MPKTDETPQRKHRDWKSKIWSCRIRRYVKRPGEVEPNKNLPIIKQYLYDLSLREVFIYFQECGKILIRELLQNEETEED